MKGWTLAILAIGELWLPSELAHRNPATPDPFLHSERSFFILTILRMWCTQGSPTSSWLLEKVLKGLCVKLAEVGGRLPCAQSPPEHLSSCFVFWSEVNTALRNVGLYSGQILSVREDSKAEAVYRNTMFHQAFFSFFLPAALG